MQRVELLARRAVLPGHDLLEPLDLDQPDRGGELAHAVVQALHRVLRLAVVAVLAGELEQRGLARHQHTALAGGDRLRGVQGVDARVAVAARPGAVPMRAVGVGAVLDQEDAVLAAVGRDALAVEGDVTADVDEPGGGRPVALGLLLEVLEGHAEVLAIAVDELHPRARVQRGERRGGERVGRAQHGAAPDLRELERRQRATRPSATPRWPAVRSMPPRPPRTRPPARPRSSGRNRSPDPIAGAAARGRGRRTRWRTWTDPRPLGQPQRSVPWRAWIAQPRADRRRPGAPEGYTECRRAREIRL